MRLTLKRGFKNVTPKRGLGLCKIAHVEFRFKSFSRHAGRTTGMAEHRPHDEKDEGRCEKMDVRHANQRGHRFRCLAPQPSPGFRGYSKLGDGVASVAAPPSSCPEFGMTHLRSALSSTRSRFLLSRSRRWTGPFDQIAERWRTIVVRYFLPGSLWPFAANASPNALRAPPPAGF